MKFRKKETGSLPDKVQIEMTPMIDVVFQLLAFFVFTFRVTQLEGDFNIRMPRLAAETKVDQPNAETVKIRMRSTDDGELASLELNGSPITPPVEGTVFDQLHLQVRQQYSDASGPKPEAASTEAELDCDYKLKYENVIKAITALSGYKIGAGDDTKTVRLIEKIRFAPVKAKP